MAKQSQCVVQELPVKKLFVDHRYQREMKPGHVRKIAENFDPKLFGTLVVSKRNGGKYAVIDGQQRLESAKLLKVTALPCEIISCETVREESRIYRLLNVSPKRVTNLEIFKTSLVEGDPVSRGLHRLMKSYGLELWQQGTNRKVGWPTFFCISQLLRMYRIQGEDHLSEIFDVLIHAYDETRPENANSAFMVGGLSRFILAADEAYDGDRLRACLKGAEPNKIKAEADGVRLIGGSRDKAIAMSIAARYNKNLQNKVLIG